MSSFYSYDGTCLHYDVVGDPGALGHTREGGLETTPVVVHPGGPARHPEYLGDLAGLADVRPLVILHPRGVGRSEPPVDAQTGWWPCLADDLESLRRHLGLDVMDLLAHSAGCRAALSYAARYPHRLDHLCLVTPPATWLVNEASDVEALIGDRYAEPWFPAVKAAFDALGPDLTATERIEINRIIAPISYAHWDDRARAHAAVGEWYPAAFAAFFDGNTPFSGGTAADLLPALRVVGAPVLVVAGAVDVLTGLKPVVALADLFPQGKAVVLDDCGHYPWVERPERFLDAVGAFLHTT